MDRKYMNLIYKHILTQDTTYKDISIQQTTKCVNYTGKFEDKLTAKICSNYLSDLDLW